MSTGTVNFLSIPHHRHKGFISFDVSVGEFGEKRIGWGGITVRKLCKHCWQSMVFTQKETKLLNRKGFK